MRRIRGQSLVSYKIIISCFLLKSFHPFSQGSNTEKLVFGSSWLLNTAGTDVHKTGSELCTFTSCSFSSYVTFTNFAIAGAFFFCISAISILCNTRVPVLWHPPQMAASQKGLTSTWSSWSFIPPFEQHVGKSKRHPWKNSVLTSRKNSQGFSPMTMRGSLCFVSVIFFPSLNVELPFLDFLVV